MGRTEAQTAEDVMTVMKSGVVYARVCSLHFIYIYIYTPTIAYSSTNYAIRNQFSMVMTNRIVNIVMSRLGAHGFHPNSLIL